MIRRYLIIHNNERQLVDSLEGYEGCKVLEENVAVPRSDHCTRENGRWKINKDKHIEDRVRAERHSKWGKLSLPELMDMIDTRLGKAGL